MNATANNTSTETKTEKVLRVAAMVLEAANDNGQQVILNRGFTYKKNGQL